MRKGVFLLNRDVFLSQGWCGKMMNNYVCSLGILNIMNQNYNAMHKSMLRIATGLRINSVADDPSGWAIGQRMNVEIRSLNQASRNSQNSQSMLKVADGAVSSTVDILRTLKEKAIQAANGTMTDADRQNIQKEFNQYIDQIDDNSLVTFNGQYLMNGSHKSQGSATQQAFTNQSLSEDTTFATQLTDLKNRSGEELHILDSDNVKVSYTKEGKTYTTTFSAKGMTLGGIFKEANKLNGDANVFDPTDLGSTATTNVIGTDANGNTVKTASEKDALTVKAKDTGLDGALGGFTISIMDSSGQMKKSVNAVLDDFTESITPRNASGDDSIYTQTGTQSSYGIKIGLGDMSARGLGLKGADGSILSVGTPDAANAAINVLDNALARALDQSTTIGAVSSRLDYTISNLTVQSENLTNAMSVITDADLAKEITEFTRRNVLLQAAQAMLAQSNQNAGWFLSLLQG